MLIVAHLSLMSIAALCLASGVGMAMFGRKKKNWLRMHKTLNASGLILALTGAVMAFANIVSSNGHHLAGPHPWTGLTAVILCGITLHLGRHSFKAKNKAAARGLHRWSGRVSFILMLAALTMGLQMIGIF